MQQGSGMKVLEIVMTLKGIMKNHLKDIRMGYRHI